MVNYYETLFCNIYNIVQFFHSFHKKTQTETGNERKGNDKVIVFASISQKFIHFLLRFLQSSNFVPILFIFIEKNGMFGLTLSSQRGHVSFVNLFSFLQ